ncbi:hypothetical protein ACSBR2_011890 [Camellia fascicularis]
MGSSLHLFLFMHLLFLSLSCFHLVIIWLTLCLLSSHYAMQTRAPPCCNSSKAFQLTNPLLVIHLLIRRLHHGSPKEIVAIAAHGMALNAITRRVIFLHGSINSSSSLFSLVHLQRLNLAYNDFDYSCIPSEIGHLSRLTSLNFSSIFSSQIPSEISKLSKLVSIDLSFNVDSSNSGLKLEKPGLRSLLQNLTNLKVLRLNDVSISSEVPDTLANLTSLTTLILENCGLRGILQLLGKLTELTKLEIRDLNLYSSIPSVLSNLTQLTYSDLSSNHISGEITSHITNLTHLIWPDLSINQLRSPTPRSLFELKNLETLDLSFNNLSGLELEIFQMLKNLTFLDLSGNNLTVLTKKTSNNTLNKLKVLGLNSCNLREFPNFLRFQNKLDVLSLAENKIHGEIPAWMLNIGVEIYLQNNSLIGFEQNPDILPWDNLLKLDLSYNRLQGPLPIPPLSTCSYSVSHNGLTGELPLLICQLSSLYVLDLSNNNLTGTILPCLSNFSDSLKVLNLKGNNFQGLIPHLYNRGNKLKMIDFSDNK